MKPDKKIKNLRKKSIKMSIKSSLPASQFELPLTNSETNSNLTYQNAELPASSVSTHPSDYTIVPRTSSPILENNQKFDQYDENQNDENHNPENNSENNNQNNKNNEQNFLFSSLLPETGHLRSIQKDVDSVISNVDQKIQSAKNLQQEARNLFPEKKKEVKSSLIRNDSFTKDRRSIPPSEEELNDPFLQASMNRSTNLTDLDSDPNTNTTTTCDNDYEYIKPLKTIQMEFDGRIDVNLISLNSEEDDKPSDATYSINSSYNGDDDNYLQDLPEGPDFTENERCHTPTEPMTDKNNNYEQCEIVPMKDNERVVQYLIKGVVVAVFLF